MIDLSNATYVAGVMDAQTGNNTFYTVPEGKILLITSWGVNARNSSSAVMGHLRLRDGGAEGAVIGSWTLGSAVAGAVAPSIAFGNTFPVLQKQISTDLFMEFVSGSVTASFNFTGYLVGA